MQDDGNVVALRAKMTGWPVNQILKINIAQIDLVLIDLHVLNWIPWRGICGEVGVECCGLEQGYQGD